MAVRVLLVEDDELIGQALVLALGDEGFHVTWVTSGEDALTHLETVAADVALLDLMLPGLDGLAVCKTLRSRGDLPIIIVTARTDSEDVIAGLEAGADDYVTKPLIARELAARIRALLRRRGPGREDALHVGELEIRPQKNEVLRAGAPAHLTQTEFRLLVELATAQGNVVTREQLLQRIWGYDYFGDTRLLDVHIRRLRRKIEPDPDRPQIVLTVRGAGYRIDADR
jgi:DNA-binding response OmpR family regulator